MTRNRLLMIAGFAFVCFVASLGSRLDVILSPNFDGLTLLNRDQLDHARGFDQTKYWTQSYTCDQATANSINVASGVENPPYDVGADSCPADSTTPTCISCNPPGTNFTLVVITDNSGTLHPPGLQANASVICGPMFTGKCATVNGQGQCQNLKPSNSNFTTLLNIIINLFQQIPASRVHNIVPLGKTFGASRVSEIRLAHFVIREFVNMFSTSKQQAKG